MPENNQQDQRNQGQQQDQQNQQQDQRNQGQQQDQGGGMPTWEAVLAGLPEDQRTLYATHTQGLRSALQSERGQRGDLAKQLREATEKLDKDSDARKELEALTGKLDAAEQRADFLQEATDPGIGCANPRLAWLAAQEIEAVDGRGRVNWDALKKQFPELFRVTAPAGNAGAGMGGKPPGGGGMNEFIRRSAGRT